MLKCSPAVPGLPCNLPAQRGSHCLGTPASGESISAQVTVAGLANFKVVQDCVLFNSHYFQDHIIHVHIKCDCDVIETCEAHREG